MDSKTALRIKAKEIRKSINIANVSDILVKKIRQQQYYKNAKNVLIFYPKGNEINLLGLLADGKNFYLPKVRGEELDVCPFKNGDELEISEFNIKEPCSLPVNPLCLDLVIVPALAVDKNNYRLGYGGGFYDRFLAKYPGLTTVVAIAKELVFDKIPVENFDVKFDFLITT